MKIIGLVGNSSAGKDTAANILVEKHGFTTVAFADELKRISKYLFEFTDLICFGEPENRNAKFVCTRGEPEVREAYWSRVSMRGEDYGFICRLHDLMAGHATKTQVATQVWKLVQMCIKQGADFTPRYALQRLGTEFGRELWPDVWINKVFTTIETLKGGSQIYSRSMGLAYMIGEPPPTGIVITDARFANEARAVRERGGFMAWVDASRRVPRNVAIAHASEPNREDFLVSDPSKPEGLADLIDFDLDNNGRLEDLPRLVGHLVQVAR